MGFFSELKEDLSQAVSELMPEEETKMLDEEAEILDEEPKMPDEEPASEKAPVLAGEGFADLDSMLDKLEQEQAQADAAEDAQPDQDADSADAASGKDSTEPADLLANIMAAEQAAEEASDTQEPADGAESEEPDAAVNVAEEPETVEKKDDQTQEPEAFLGGIPAESNYMEGVESNMEEQYFSENEAASDEKSVITEGMTINGDIISKGSVDVLGSITGNIDILGKLDVSGSINGISKAAEVYAENAKIVGDVNSQGSVKIGQSSVIIGNISATSAVIAGAIKGDIDVRGPVVLDTSAIVMGNIKSKSVQINNGAVVEGLCSQCYADVNPSAFFDEFKKTAKA